MLAHTEPAGRPTAPAAWGSESSDRFPYYVPGTLTLRKATPWKGM
jgi:hypothetical protein